MLLNISDDYNKTITDKEFYTKKTLLNYANSILEQIGYDKLDTQIEEELIEKEYDDINTELAIIVTKEIQKNKYIKDNNIQIQKISNWIKFDLDIAKLIEKIVNEKIDLIYKNVNVCKELETTLNDILVKKEDKLKSHYDEIINKLNKEYNIEERQINRVLIKNKSNEIINILARSYNRKYYLEYVLCSVLGKSFETKINIIDKLFDITEKQYSKYLTILEDGVISLTSELDKVMEDNDIDEDLDNNEDENQEDLDNNEDENQEDIDNNEDENNEDENQEDIENNENEEDEELKEEDKPKKNKRSKRK